MDIHKLRDFFRDHCRDEPDESENRNSYIKGFFMIHCWDCLHSPCQKSEKRNTILTHWGRVTHICVSKLTIIGSDDGLPPGRRQAISWTNAGILLIRTLATNFSEILSEIHAFSYKKMHLKMSSAKWRPFCLGLKMLRDYLRTINSLWPSGAIWHHSAWSSLVQVMAWHLKSVKPLPEQNADLLLIGPSRPNFGEILMTIQQFSVKKMHLKMPSAKYQPFCSGLNVLTNMWFKRLQ